MRQEAPLACVHIIRRKDNVMYSARCRRYTILLHLLVALTMHVYILPGIVANEGQLVGSRADHFAILSVKLLAELQSLASHEMENREKLGSAS